MAVQPILYDSAADLGVETNSYYSGQTSFGFAPETMDYDAGVAAGVVRGRQTGIAISQARGYAIGYDDGADEGAAAVRGSLIGTGMTLGGGPSDVIGPDVAAISPTPGIAPGEDFGFSSSRRDAAVTPVVFTVGDDDSDIEYVCITVRAYDSATDDGTEQLVYRDGAYRNTFRESTISGDPTDALTFTVRRVDGWLGRYLAFSIDAIDTSGNRTTSMFIYELPAEVPAVEEFEVVNENDGTIDHVARALDRMPQQYRSEDDE